MDRARLHLAAVALLLGALAHTVSGGAKVDLLLPLGRTAYQTNERIDLAVVRSAPEPLAAGTLTLTLAGADGSRLRFAFPARAAAVQGDAARATEHLRLNGWLLRPGTYRAEAACDGATATAELQLYTHLRKSDFKLINWGRAKGKAQLPMGEDSLGFNLFYGHYARDEQANFIRAGVDFMSCCTMGGGHQMDLRTECDWSDPYVVRGGTMRVVRQALTDRTRPNVPGVHFYDEPGLTWGNHPVTGDWTPHGVPAQVRSYTAAFGRKPIAYHEVDPRNPDHVRRWKHWATWKLGFMDAAWRDSQFGVSYVEPTFLSVTQSQYGWSAYTDGYYFNVVRCLPVVSGHGGYHDYGLGYFNPSLFLEMARARDLGKPCWYLPTWYGNTTADHFRLEQYLSFQTNIQGMISPPDIDPFDPAKKPAAEGVVESNKLMARLGTIFNTFPVTRPPVAMLYSLSHLLHAQARDRSVNYAHGEDHGRNLFFTYLAGKLLHRQFMAVVDEDVVDGTLAANHKAIVLTSIDHLDPPVLAALEAFAAGGGLVLTAAGCEVKVKGAIDLGVTPTLPDAAIVDKLLAEKKYDEARPYLTVGKQIQAARPLAKVIEAQLDKAAIPPVFECDNPGIVATRQAAGDVEYLFAVNAAYDEAEGGFLSIKPTVATIALPDDRRPVYDAVRGGPAAGFQKQGGKLAGTFRFGPGQMRVFARTARPIFAVKALVPVLRRDLTLDEAPIRVDVGATVLTGRRLNMSLSARGPTLTDVSGVLAGSVPLVFRVTDPLGATRYELYRATNQGTCRLSLPLAATDPAGEWKVVVRELLRNTEDTATFVYRPLARCGALAGTARRAVAFAPDLDRIHRFARVHSDVTLVKGSSTFNDAAADRLAAVLKPWGVRVTTMPLADAAKARTLTEDEARTWCGLTYAGKGQVKPGDKNRPVLAGFAVRGPVILLGNPGDHPIIQFLLKERFLPFTPEPDRFPGRGRGMLAWQRDGVGRGQESITLIAHDAAGMAEAVGSLYEAVAGLRPLTPWQMPSAHSLTPATTAPGLVPEPATAWQVVLPDRAVAMKVAGGQLRVLTHDDSLTVVDAKGTVISHKPVSPAQRQQLAEQLAAAPDAAALALARKSAPPDRIVKYALPGAGHIAVGYWGGTLELLGPAGALKLRRQMPQDITALAWLGDRLAIALADGRLLALTPK